MGEEGCSITVLIIYLINRIAIQNREKILNGETVRIKPYNILEHFDKSGLKHGLKINTVFENYQVLT